MEEEIRLQKYLANNGILSRRKAEEAILEGKVKVDGKVVTELGTKIIPTINKIEYEGKVVDNKEEKVYVLLNEMANSINKKDSEVFYIKYKNFMKEIESI